MKVHLEPIVPSGRSSFNAFKIRKARFDHSYHYHPEIEMAFIRSSRGTFIIGDAVGEFREGDCFLLGDSLPHLFINSEDCTDPAEAEVLQYSRQGPLSLLEKAPEWHAYAMLLEKARLGLVFDRITSERACLYFESIRLADPSERWTPFLALISLFLQAPEPRVLASPGFAPHLVYPGSTRIQQVCQFILKNFRENLKHEDVARVAHLAPASFSRIFRRTTHKTFSQFLNQVRLGHACRMLLESDKSIAEVAFASGFNNLSNFNRRFRERYHKTPRAYRAQVK